MEAPHAPPFGARFRPAGVTFLSLEAPAPGANLVWRRVEQGEDLLT